MVGKTIFTNFNSGELSPDIEGRIDLKQYYQGARSLQNWIVLPQGGIAKRRGFLRLGEIPMDYPDTCKTRVFTVALDRLNIFNIVFTSEGKIHLYRYNTLVASFDSEIYGGSLEDVQIATLGSEAYFVHPSVKPFKINLFTSSKSDLTFTQPPKVKSFYDYATVTSEGFRQYYTTLSYINNGDDLRIRVNAPADIVTDIVVNYNVIERGILDGGQDADAFIIDISNKLEDILGADQVAVSPVYRETEYNGATVKQFLGLNIFLKDQTTSVNFIGCSNPESKIVTSKLSNISVRDTEIKRNAFDDWGSGNPTSIAFLNGRLILSGTREHPEQIWFSRVNDYKAFGAEEEVLNLFFKSIPAPNIHVNILLKVNDQIAYNKAFKRKPLIQSGGTTTQFEETVTDFYSRIATDMNNSLDSDKYSVFAGSIGLEIKTSDPDTEVEIVENNYIGSQTITEPLASDGFSLTLNSNSSSQIISLYGWKRLLVMTTQGVFSVYGGEGDEVLKSDNASSSLEANVECDYSQPLMMDNKVFLLQRGGSELTNLSYDIASGYTTYPNSLLSNHLINSPWDLQLVSKVDEFNSDMLFILNRNGTLSSFRRMEVQEISNWTPIVTQGFIYSISGGYDELFVTTKRNGRQFLEVMKSENHLLDCSTSFSMGVKTTEFNQIAPLYADTTVSVLADGYALKDIQVSSDGSFTLPFNALEVTIGYPIECILETVPAVATDQSGSSTKFKRKRITNLKFDLQKSSGFEVEYNNRSYTIGDRRTGFQLRQPPALMDDIKEVFLRGYTDTATIRIIDDRPYPIKIRSIELNVTR